MPHVPGHLPNLQGPTGMIPPLGQELFGIPVPATAQQQMAMPAQQGQQGTDVAQMAQALQGQAAQGAGTGQGQQQAGAGGGGFNAGQVAGLGLTGIAGLIALANAFKEQRGLDEIFEPAMESRRRAAAAAARRRGLTGGAAASLEASAASDLEQQLALARRAEEQRRNQALLQGLAQLAQLGIGIGTGNPMLAIQGGAGVAGSAGQAIQSQRRI